MLPSAYRPASQLQPVSEYDVWFLLQNVLQRAPHVADKSLFDGCRTVEDVMFRLSESEIIKALFLTGKMDGIGRLGEFYIALRTMKEWKPRAGFDVWGSFEYLNAIATGKIEVKTCSPSDTRHQWDPRITGNDIQIHADVLVVLGMRNSFNPSEASMFVIPKHALQPVVEEHLSKEGKDRPRISILKHRHNLQTKKTNPWYEYEVINHSTVKERIAQYVHGDFSIIPQQMTLF